MALRQASARVRPIRLDVTDGESIAHAANTVREAVGAEGLSGLVNNAGFGDPAPLEYVPLEDVRRQFEVNVVGQIAVTQAFLPYVRLASGRIVNLGSVGDRITMPFGDVLCSCKSALATLTEALRLELRPWGIHVCLIEPGSIATPAVVKTAAQGRKLLSGLSAEATDRYGRSFGTFLDRVLHRTEQGSSPDVVANIILKALTESRPRTRYPVGKDARLLTTIARFPDRVLDGLRLRLLHLPSGFGALARPRAGRWHRASPGRRIVMSSFRPESIADVAIVGAGPTGLALAISLVSRGRNILVIERRKDEDNTSRAAVVYPGTLELLDPYGVSARLVSRGIRTPQFTIRDRDRVLMAVPFGRLPTAFPFALLVSQAATEAELRRTFQRLGGRTLQGFEATGVTQNGDGVTIELSSGDSLRARFAVGADGVHSAVRSSLQIAYEGNSAGESYTLADVRLDGGVPGDELVVYFSSAGHMVVLPLPGGIHRIVGHVREAPEHPSLGFLQELLDARGPKRERAVIREIVWGSRFLTRHALAERYRSGRVLLAGDAAHEHSPLGGQGMNLGIHDAVALGRALSMALASGSTDLLDSYGDVQRPIAGEVISVTDLLTKIATTNEHLREIRNVLLHVLDPMIRTRLAWRLSLLEYQEEARQKRPAYPQPGDSRGAS